MNNAHYTRLIEKYPNLTSEGFGVSRKAEFDLRREELKNDFPEFLLCLVWLDDHTFERESSAEELKEVIQAENNPGV